MSPATLRPPAPPAPHEPGSPWNVGELPAHTRLSMSTIERLIKSGSLASFKVGRRRLVPDDAVRRLVAGNS